ncbi:MAG: hypothetical protein ACLQPN_09160 [Bryobacteraceae bacterium]
MRRLKVTPVDGPRQVSGYLQFALHERPVDDELGGVIRERSLLDQFDVSGERLEIALHPVHADGDGTDQTGLLGNVHGKIVTDNPK